MSTYKFKEEKILPFIKLSESILQGETNTTAKKGKKTIKISSGGESMEKRKKREPEYLKRVYEIEAALKGMLEAYEGFKKLPR